MGAVNEQSRPPLAKETRRLGGANGEEIDDDVRDSTPDTSNSELHIVYGFLGDFTLESNNSPSLPTLYSLLNSLSPGQISYFLVCLHLQAIVGLREEWA